MGLAAIELLPLQRQGGGGGLWQRRGLRPTFAFSQVLGVILLPDGLLQLQVQKM